MKFEGTEIKALKKHQQPNITQTMQKINVISQQITHAWTHQDRFSE